MLINNRLKDYITVTATETPKNKNCVYIEWAKDLKKYTVQLRDGSGVLMAHMTTKKRPTIETVAKGHTFAFFRVIIRDNNFNVVNTEIIRWGGCF